MSANLTHDSNEYVTFETEGRVHMINKLGHYIWRRMQADNIKPERRKSKPRDMMSGLYVSANDFQRYVNDYFEYGIDYFGGDDYYQPEDFTDSKIDVYWDEGDGDEV